MKRPRRQWTEADIKLLGEMRLAGMSYVKLSHQFGASVATIRNLLGGADAASAPNKFGAKGVWLDGVYFPSRAEAQRAELLKAREKAGEIAELKFHRRYKLYGFGGVEVGEIEVDASYLEHGKGLVDEDTKPPRWAMDGPRRRLFDLKRRLFEAQFPGRTITVIEATKRRRAA